MAASVGLRMVGRIVDDRRHDRPLNPGRGTHMLEQMLKDARRLATIGTFFIVAGWVFTIYALVAGVIWWIDLASREAFNIIEGLAISASAIGLPLFAAFAIAGLGYALRLFALYVASKAQ
jgi:TRAP-type C4-dicarboxylate transport system permease small subunit